MTRFQSNQAQGVIIKRLLKRLFSFKKKTPSITVDPKYIIPRAAHPISRKDLGEYTLKVLYRLRKANYQACVVGGGVRDLLLNLAPRDFDIATDATPQQIKKLFRNCRLIGRRFRLAHIHFGRHIIEVTTYRGKDSEDTTQCEHTGLITHDNSYGSLHEDAWRRDITINALYYNIDDFSIIDLTGGMEDLKKRQIRIIGDPEQRYREDPVRMLRVLRFAAKLDFNVEEKTFAPIKQLAPLLKKISSSRLFNEVIKLAQTGKSKQVIELFRQQDLFQILFPQTAAQIDQNAQALTFIEQALINTDERINSGKSTTVAFLYAVLLWHPFQAQLAQIKDEELSFAQKQAQAMHKVLSEQNKQTSVPKYYVNTIRDIWHLQSRLTHKLDRRAFKVLAHARFRAGYDFLLLREKIEPQLEKYTSWWTRFQSTDEENQEKMVKIAHKRMRPKKHTRKTNHAASDKPPSSPDSVSA
jgi:poly(A) polymerase